MNLLTQITWEDLKTALLLVFLAMVSCSGAVLLLGLRIKHVRDRRERDRSK